jgi:hypothetical protein
VCDETKMVDVFREITRKGGHVGLRRFVCDGYDMDRIWCHFFSTSEEVLGSSHS